MSSSNRQNRLLVAEDWKTIYQSFENADFQSYDFENLRRVMINYIRQNYPENFNDYIESSEYLALLDLIAYIGQSISFRTDLNARENFLDTAERRDSILRLARLLSYKVKRNIPASGFLKFSSVSTTETIFDSNGLNLSSQVITWNDSTNSNWYDQFIRIINAALSSTNKFGNPDSNGIIGGIPTEQYKFQNSSSGLPVYNFSKPIDGINMDFEVVSTIFSDTDGIYEEPPKLGNKLSFIYRDDGKGNGSNNTGFFLHFKQGTLNQGTFTVTQPSTDETIDLNANNINNSDVWLYRLDKNSKESELWSQVPNFENNNIIYNSLNKSIKNVYGVLTRNNDQISLIFSDGVFGNLPLGTFRIYYRTSNGLRYTINSRDITSVFITIPYVGSLGQEEQLTLNLNLQSSITNSSPSEDNENIKSRAPSTYYTQNRMITAEDYNLSPLSVNQEIIKIKSINRTSSGISRYFDLIDPTGKYSKTNLFADDGVIYKENYLDTFKFKFNTRSDIESVIYNQFLKQLKSFNLRNFYYNNVPGVVLTNLGVKWKTVSTDVNQVSGYITTSDNSVLKVGTYTSTLLKYFTLGALVKFKAPEGKYFDKSKNNQLVNGQPIYPMSTDEIWTTVISIAGDGTNNNTGILINKMGTIVLNDLIPSDAILDEIIPAFRTVLDQVVVRSMVDLIYSNKPFGLRYDNLEKNWKIINESNLNTISDFNVARQGDNNNEKIDSSWLILFTTDTEFYTVTLRLERFIFESDKQIRFYFDSSDKVYDTRNNTTVKDVIKVLSINNRNNTNVPFTYDKDWEITDQYIGLDGYVDSKKIQVTFFDNDDDGIVDDPTLFIKLVNFEDSAIPDDLKYVVLKKYQISEGQEDYKYIKNNNEVLFFQNETGINLNLYNNGQAFYFKDSKVVKIFNKQSGVLESTLNYKIFPGRDELKFQYIHNADYEARIDPGLTNIIDIYVLTKQYDILYRQYVQGSLTSEPLPLSTSELYDIFSKDLNKIKSLSDEIVYHPVKYKILFGNKATIDVQATFKVIKNKESVVSDNDIKTRVLLAINEFFSIENWNFGENFYFSELNAYVVKSLAPDILNFVIVPKKSDLYFGSLFEIKAEKDQIFINGATIDDIEIIETLTSTAIKSINSISSLNQVLSYQSIRS